MNKKNIIQLHTLVILITLCFTASYSQTIRYVKPVSAGTGNGASWLNASNDLQAIINVSSSGDEIWVAAGTYIPIRNVNDLTDITPNNYDNAFVLKEGVKIYGSFTGNETALSQRVLPEYSDTVTYSSILSGDFNGDDITSINEEFYNTTNNTENAGHIIIAAGSEESPLTSLTTLDGFTIIGAYAYTRDYGACYVNDQIIWNNEGGGLYNLYSAVTYNNLAFTFNMAHSTGAGILNKFSSSVFTNITAKGNESLDSGGGMHNNSSFSIVNNAFFKGNKAIQGSGAGIFNTMIYDEQTSELSLTNVKVNHNIAGVSGGGIYNSFANLTLINGEVNNNEIKHPYSPNDINGLGAGIFNSTGVVTITDSYINSNHTKGDGGGIYNVGDDTVLILNNVTLDGNSVDTGSGITIRNNMNSTLIIDSSIISNNESNPEINQVAAAIYNSNDSFVTCTNSTISGNTGGGFVNHYASSDFTNVVITQNSGSGVYNSGTTTTATYNDVTISYNMNGGAINTLSCNTSYTNVIIEGNSAISGAGLSTGGATSIFTDVKIINNTATNNGGGVSNYGGEPVFINTIISGNTAGGKGGGIHDINCTSILTNCEIKGNSAMYGGGIYFDISSSIVTNTLISGNSASFYGGGVYNGGSSPLLTNVTITGNYADLSTGSGMYNGMGGTSSFIYSFPVVRNSIVWGNNDNDMFTGLLSGLTSTNNLIGGVTTTDANGNIDGTTNPLFIEYISASSAPTTDGNYTLASNSPLINIGNNVYFSEGQTPDLSIITTDLAGNTRIQEATIDLGAYEYNICNIEAPTGNPTQEITITEGETPTISDLEINGSNIVWYASLEDIENNIILSPETELTNNTTYYAVETTGDCQSEPFAVTVSITLSINNFNKQNLRYYPNPVTDKLYLENDTTIGIVAVYNIPGKKIMEVNLSESTGYIDLSLLQSGTYIVKLISDTNNSYFLIIKS